MTETWLEQVGIGLTLWDGVFEGKHDRWLRWSTREGVVPTGAEQAEQERQRAEQERQRAERAEARATRLEEQLRTMGIDPDV